MHRIFLSTEWEISHKMAIKGSEVVQWRTQEFCSGGGGGEAVQQIQLRTEDRENGDLGAVAP